MGGSGANNRGSSNVATGRTSLVEGLALAERLVAQSAEEGARTATMNVRDVMSLLVSEQQIAQGGAEPGRSGVRPAVRDGAAPNSPDPALPGPKESDVSVEFSWAETAPVLELVPEAPPAAPVAALAPTELPAPVVAPVHRAPASIPAPSRPPVKRRSKLRRLFAALLFVAIMSASFYVLLEAMKRQGLTLPPEVAALRERVVSFLSHLH